LEVGEETKAIPLYNQFDSINELEETKLVNDDDTTKHNSPVTDSKKKPKMKRWKKILIVFLIIALVVGAGISAFVLLKPKYVDVPDVTGLDYDEARETLEKLNLEETKLVNDDDTTKHNSPVTDSKKKPKMKRWKKILIVFLIIALVVGAGISAFVLLKPKYVDVPDVTGLDYDEARETLEKLNL